MSLHEACRFDQLVEGRGRPVRIEGLYLAVFLVKGQVHVIDNMCLHVGSPLDGGPVVDGDVVCPWHGWRYSLETGRQRTAFGDRQGVGVYQFVVEDGIVKIRID